MGTMLSSRLAQPAVSAASSAEAIDLADLALDREDVGGSEFAVVALRPEMRVGRCVDQLDGDAHAVARALHAAFEDLRHAELLRRSLSWAASCRGTARRTCAQITFKCADLRELRQDVVVDAIGEEGVLAHGHCGSRTATRRSDGLTSAARVSGTCAGRRCGRYAHRGCRPGRRRFARVLVAPERFRRRAGRVA